MEEGQKKGEALKVPKREIFGGVFLHKSSLTRL
jgi:hypothetical protein